MTEPLARLNAEQLLDAIAAKLPTNLNREWAAELIATIKEAGWDVVLFSDDASPIIEEVL